MNNWNKAILENIEYYDKEETENKLDRLNNLDRKIVLDMVNDDNEFINYVGETIRNKIEDYKSNPEEYKKLYVSDDIEYESMKEKRFDEVDLLNFTNEYDVLYVKRDSLHKAKELLLDHDIDCNTLIHPFEYVELDDMLYEVEEEETLTEEQKAFVTNLDNSELLYFVKKVNQDYGVSFVDRFDCAYDAYKDVFNKEVNKNE